MAKKVGHLHRRVFVCVQLHSRFRPGVLLCDPLRLDQLLEGDSRGRDLTEVFVADEGGKVFRDGVSVLSLDDESDAPLVAVREAHAKTIIGRTPRLVSDGWILGTESGNLVVCSLDSALYWDPFAKDEDPKRYFEVSVPRGWYRVKVRAGKLNDAARKKMNDETLEDGIEFVLTPQKRRPGFCAKLLGDQSAYAGVSDSRRSTALTKPERVPLDAQLLKGILSRLTPAAFERFVFELFNERGSEQCERVNKAGEGVFYRPLLDSYGGTLHSVFLVQNLPLSVFREPQIARMADDPCLVPKLNRVRETYRGTCGYFGMVSPELVKAARLSVSGGMKFGLGGRFEN